jgi:1-aminocyclopropane-1-carboxylate deaminase/D-cysteine desulfhydrase-like pyridoxal-dependent ACC family enzyme
MYGALRSLPVVPFAPTPSPVEELTRLRAALRAAPRLFVKRDDALTFAFGGNKVRKMRFIAARAQSCGADTLITTGGVQSNHARVTAAAAAKLGMKCVLVVNGLRQERPTANALLDTLLGAEVRYVQSRDERVPAMEAAADRVRNAGGSPFIIPLGASTPLGAAGFVDAISELAGQIDPPDVIVHSTSSGGTQAGLVAGCSLAGWPARVIGISADASSAILEQDIRGLLGGVAEILGFAPQRFDSAMVTVDDGYVGAGYGVATPESREAIELTARTEALFLDPTYTAKAMAGLIARIRRRDFDAQTTVLFWHTGGQVGLFA